MASWLEVTEAAPDLSAKVRSRFETHGLAILASLRRDGGPRVSAIEPLFGAGELWLGMMPGSFKAMDVSRDPRLALHSATIDKDVKDGDAKVTGLAVGVEDEATFELYRKAGGMDGSAALGGFHLFKVNVKAISHLIPAGDHLDIETWTETEGYRRIARA